MDNEIKLTIVTAAHLPTLEHINVFFSRAIESLAKQTYKNFKLIIVLNGVYDYEKSIDKIKRKLLEEYQPRFLHNIEIYNFEEKMGVSKATNFGLKKATTEYVGFQAADDCCVEYRLERQIKILLENKEIDICASGMFESGNVCLPFVGSFEQIRNNIRYSNIIMGGTAICKFSMLDKVDFFDENHPLGSEDWDLWKRCALAGANFYNLSEPLYEWFHDYSTFVYYNNLEKS